MRFIVAGGGYAGQAASKAIKSSLPKGSLESYDSIDFNRLDTPKHELILIDKNPYATVFPLLPDLAAEKVTPSSVKGDFKKILPHGIKFIQGNIESLDLESKVLTLKDANGSIGGSFEFDVLVMAWGSRTNTKPCTDFSGKFYCIDNLKETMSLSREISERKTSGKSFDILIIGAGYTAIEVAANLEYGCRSDSEDLPHIHILSRSGEILRNVPDVNSDLFEKYLLKNDIKIHKGVELKSWDGETAVLSNGDIYSNPIVIAASGMTSSMKYVTKDQPSHAAGGRIEVDRKLRVKGYNGIYAAGDAAALRDSSGKGLRRSVNFAIYSGAAAGRNAVKHFIDGTEKDFKPIDLGWVIPAHGESFGKIFGVIPISGKPGMRLHYLMCGLRNFTVKNFFYYFMKSIKLFDSKGEKNERKY